MRHGQLQAVRAPLPGADPGVSHVMCDTGVSHVMCDTGVSHVMLGLPPAYVLRRNQRLK